MSDRKLAGMIDPHMWTFNIMRQHGRTHNMFVGIGLNDVPPLILHRH